MQPCKFARVAHPILITVLTLAILIGQSGFAHAAPGDQKIYYYLPDHLGGVDKMTDEQGNVVCSNDYLPFGDLRRGDCTENDEDYGFTGKEKDPETDFYYYGARYYDPMLGRFVSPDPLNNALDTMNPQELNDFLKDPQNLNSYTYVKNNPLKYIDPTGESAVTMSGIGRMIDGLIKFFAGMGIALTPAKGHENAGLTIIYRGGEDIGRGFNESTMDEKWQSSTLEKVIDNLVKEIGKSKLKNPIKRAAFNLIFEFDAANKGIYAVGEKVEKLGEAVGEALHIRKQDRKKDTVTNQNRAKINTNQPKSDTKKPRIPKKEKHE